MTRTTRVLLLILLLPILLLCPCVTPDSIEESLIKLLDSPAYNKNSRPPTIINNTRRYDYPTNVFVDFHIVSFSTMSVQNMDFTINIYLRMIWQEDRLARLLPADSEAVSLHTVKDKIWLPDIFFRNAKEVDSHKDPVPNILVKLQPNGDIYFSQKLTVRLWCLMDLRNFPMDCQTCRIEIGAYGSSLNEVRFQWYSSSITLEEDAMQVPEFTSPSIVPENCTKSFSVTGDFACLRARVRLRRSYGFYLMNTYVPFTLMVSISWIGFWIDVRSTPARVTIAFLTVLAVATQNAGTQMTGMPRVSYFKAIDLFMLTSLIFVIGALVEFAIANFLNRQNEKLRSRPLNTTDSSSNSRKRPPQQAGQAGRVKACCYGSFNGSRLDYWCRFLFPISYALFQAAYWPYYLRDWDQCQAYTH